jgi:hypothetical protein
MISIDRAGLRIVSVHRAPDLEKIKFKKNPRVQKNKNVS